MRIKLSFLGAAQNVTGSRYLLQADRMKVLVDCGLYQERHLRARNWEEFPVKPRSIDAVLLTHAHLDHCGLLPKLVKEGFRGKIHCTPATADIARIVLLDSAKLQEEDAQYKRKRHKREGRTGRYPEVPLYTTDDARACLRHFSPVKYDQPKSIGDGVEVSYHDAGHILGSSMVKVNVKLDGERRSVLFSGDVGRRDRPILRDPSIFHEADYVLIESTYGDRVHETSEEVKDQLCEIINSTHQAGGNIVIPSFAIERSQELLYHLNELLLADRIPHLMVFLDSPMAINVTEVFQEHPELFDEEMTEYDNRKQSPFDFPGLKMVRTTRESKSINHIKGTVVIIAGSGMCTGGRVKHHLVHNISRPESAILFVGYQAVGTLGREILDGAETVRILGQRHKVKAGVERIEGFSAHADRDELLKWLSALRKPPRRVFVVHGDAESSERFASYIQENTGWLATAPAYQDEVVLD